MYYIYETTSRRGALKRAVYETAVPFLWRLMQAERLMERPTDAIL
jgi:hypothetical protein